MTETLPRPQVLRASSAADLTLELEKLRKELWDARIKIKEGALAQTHRVPLLRRQIARIHTIMNEQRKRS